jgi:Flp pilus assembly pilin Flp
MLFRISVLIHATVESLLTDVAARVRRDEAGQATAEYALVLCGAAAVAVLVIAWATSTGKISGLFDAVLEKVTGKAN